MIQFLPLLGVLSAGAISVVAIGIGTFYRLKFGESTQGWLLGAGAGLGMIAQLLSSLPGVPSIASELVYLPATVLLTLGTVWLWFVMMGPRR